MHPAYELFFLDPETRAGEYLYEMQYRKDPKVERPVNEKIPIPVSWKFFVREEAAKNKDMPSSDAELLKAEAMTGSGVDYRG